MIKLKDIDEERWDSIFRVNLNAPMFLSQVGCTGHFYRDTIVASYVARRFCTRISVVADELCMCRLGGLGQQHRTRYVWRSW